IILHCNLNFEEQIEKLEGKQKDLQKKSEFKRITIFPLEHYKTTKENLSWYSDIKEELEKNRNTSE
ncbi:MAG: hypothetical protein ACJ72V_03795, partial [Nitrososphaeraceae archaeon]